MAGFTKDSGIYCIEHIASGKRYVGSAQNLDTRLKAHIRYLKKNTHHSPQLQAVWNKYGASAFAFVIILKCPIEDLLVREQQELDILDAVKSGYNTALFAGAPMRGRKMSQESRDKISASSKFRAPISEETRSALRQTAIDREIQKKDSGFVVSDETRAKLVAKLTGRPVSKESREKASKSNSGRALTEEHRKKLSDSHKGKTLSDSNKAAIAFANIGRKHSDEAKKKMSDAAKSRSPELMKNLDSTGRKATDEAKENMRKAQTGKVKSEEAKAKLRASLAAHYANKKALAEKLAEQDQSLVRI